MEYFFKPGERVSIDPKVCLIAEPFGTVVEELPGNRVRVRLDRNHWSTAFAKVYVSPLDAGGLQSSETEV